MYKVVLLFFMLLTLSGFSQKLKIEKETDKFTGKTRVKTSQTYLYLNFLDYINAKLRSVDTTYFISFMGNMAVGVIGINDETILLLEDDSKINLSPTSIQSYEISSSGSYYDHQYSITKKQLVSLSKAKIISMRRYFNNSYSDFDIKEKRAESFIKNVQLFLQNIE